VDGSRRWSRTSLGADLGMQLRAGGRKGRLWAQIKSASMIQHNRPATQFWLSTATGYGRTQHIGLAASSVSLNRPIRTGPAGGVDRIELVRSVES